MFSATVTPDSGEPFDVTAKSRDVVRWEKAKPGRRSLGQLQETMSMTAVTELIYVAAHRQGLWSGTEDEFLDGVDIDLHAPADDDEVGPT